MRRVGLVMLLALLLVGGLASSPAQAEWRPRYKLVHLINEVRGRSLYLSDRGTAPQQAARAHSIEMRSQGGIFHSSYRPCWYFGENVGVVRGGDGALRRIFDAFMDSAPHRANILNPEFRRVGIGVAVSDGLVWVTLVFCG